MTPVSHFFRATGALVRQASQERHDLVRLTNCDLSGGRDAD